MVSEAGWLAGRGRVSGGGKAVAAQSPGGVQAGWRHGLPSPAKPRLQEDQKARLVEVCCVSA